MNKICIIHRHVVEAGSHGGFYETICTETYILHQQK